VSQAEVHHIVLELLYGNPPFLPSSRTRNTYKYKVGFVDNMRDLDNHFGEYSHLQHMPRADEALHTIRKVASCVKPIMRKRGWTVGVLAEFYPDQANLWGMRSQLFFRLTNMY
jgi:hypothetical protein